MGRSTGLSFRDDGGYLPEGFEPRRKVPQSRVQRFLIHGRQVDEFNPSGLDAQPIEPGARIIGPLAGSHGPFQVLAGLLGAC